MLYKFKEILEIFSIENVKLLLVLSIHELGPNKLYVIYWKYVVSAELSKRFTMKHTQSLQAHNLIILTNFQDIL